MNLADLRDLSFKRDRTQRIVHLDDRWDVWVPLTYTDIRRVLTEPRIYSSISIDVTGSTQIVRALPPMTSDPPSHILHRRAFTRALSSAGPRLSPTLISAWCGQLLDAIDDSTPVDLVKEYAQPLSYRVTAELLGLGPNGAKSIGLCIQQIASEGNNAHQGRSTLLTLLLQEILICLRTRRAGLIAELTSAYAAGHLSDIDQLLSMCYLACVAASDSTWAALASSIWYLSAHPRDRYALAKGAEMPIRAVEELLRYFAPVATARTATVTDELSGHRVRPGDRVIVLLDRANRDPAFCNGADRVILERPAVRHVTFGWGIHRCPGAGLGRQEVLIGLRTLLRRYPDLRMYGENRIEWTPGQVRGPKHLSVILRS